jgi:hypothetical protein
MQQNAGCHYVSFGAAGRRAGKKKEQHKAGAAWMVETRVTYILPK